MNTIALHTCPSVICQPKGHAFKWESPDGTWPTGDDLPPEIAAQLPGPEWARCELHRWRRIIAHT
jgi:hypothetical protein